MRARWLAAISRECRTAPNGMMPWLIPSSVRLNSSVTSCRARQCSTQVARSCLSFPIDRFYPVSRDWASVALASNAIHHAPRGCSSQTQRSPFLHSCDFHFTSSDFTPSALTSCDSIHSCSASARKRTAARGPAPSFTNGMRRCAIQDSTVRTLILSKAVASALSSCGPVRWWRPAHSRSLLWPLRQIV